MGGVFFILRLIYFFLFLRYMITTMITTAATARTTNGAIGVVSPVFTASVDSPLLSVLSLALS